MFPNMRIGEGTVVFHGAVINSDVEVGNNCIINSQSLIEHDVKIGSQVHISTGAKVNGGCKIEMNFIGSGAVIRENVEIGINCIIGAGAVIKKILKIA